MLIPNSMNEKAGLWTTGRSQITFTLKEKFNPKPRLRLLVPPHRDAVDTRNRNHS